MHLKDLRRTGGPLLLAAVLLAASAGDASAGIQGISGTTFNLTARTDRIGTPEGGSYLIWGPADGGGRAQYPAPTRIVPEDQTITVTLTNGLPVDAHGDSHNVVAQGYEGGGHTGRIGTMALLPQAIDAAYPVPVLAAGGIGDGRGLAAALAMGCIGAWVGTRFLATNEAGALSAQQKSDHRFYR